MTRLKHIFVNQNRNNYNQHTLPIYSCSLNICALGFNKLLESIFCILLVVETFPCKELVEMFEEVPVGWWEVSWLWWWDPTLWPNSFNVWSTGWAVCGWVLSRGTGPFLLTKADCGCCSFQRIWSMCWTYFSNAMVSQDSESCGGSDSQHTLKQGTWLFTVQVWLWEVRWSLLIPFSSHVTIHSRISSLLLHRIREDDTSKWCFGPNVLMLWVVSCALQPILHSNKKITETCLSNSISMF